MKPRVALIGERNEALTAHRAIESALSRKLTKLAWR